jgi:hypothetical protein
LSKEIAVFASARRNGNTGKLIDWIAKELKMKVIDLSEKISLLMITTIKILMMTSFH